MNGNQNQPIRRYMPGLDGLRALSVLAVIAYHLDLKWAQGGLLGVGIFFVLSGYLITDQILLEWKTYRRLSLMDFWLRRIRRLLPAMICMIGFVAVWLIGSDPPLFQALKGEFLSSLFYVNNWYLIFHEVSYFESFGPPSPIGHLWSLSIEEQFYLVWPIVLVIGIKLAPRRGKLMLWLLAGAAVSALAMAVIYEPGTDPSRVYYGTDTRAFALLIGAALAVIWPSWKLNGAISTSARSLLDVSGSLGLVILMILIFGTNKLDDWLYRGGFLFIALLTATITAVLVHPASRLGKIMGCEPLKWIGKRSYSLYIWHYPVMILTNSAANDEAGGLGRVFLQLAISLLLSALSYKYVEEPIRRGKSTSGKEETRMKRSKVGAAWGIVLIIIVICATGLPSTVHEPPETRNLAPKSEPALSGEQQLNHREPLTGEGVTVIGDSVIIGVEPYLKEVLPKIVVDGKEGRQMSQALDVIDKLQAQGKLGDQIILELGTNGPFKKQQLRSLLESLSDKEQVLLVTTRVPKDWQDAVNANIQSVADEFSNVDVVDWYAASKDKADYFYQDGVHLKPDGSRYFASLLVEALQKL